MTDDIIRMAAKQQPHRRLSDFFEEVTVYLTEEGNE